MESIAAQWNQAPNWAKTTTFIALPAAGFVTARFIDGYQAWLNLGPGGLPYNVTGYLLTLLGTALFARSDTKSLGMYERPEKYMASWKQASSAEKKNVEKTFLQGSLPEREGPRAAAIHYAAPQREKNADEYIDPDLAKAYEEAFDKLAEKHSGALEWKTSVLERRGKAMFLRETYAVPTLIAKCRRELAHIHDTDKSGHLLLSFADAKEVIGKGWGERHRFTGTSLIPLGYTLLYVPRKMEEIDTFMQIFEAGVEYAKSNGKQ